jgi:protocatechuate 3,4-dioxygenase beta subunit
MWMRTIGTCAAVAIGVIAAVTWYRCSDNRDRRDVGVAAGSAVQARTVDSRSEARGSIAGRVTNSAGDAVAGARVCADTQRTHECTNADDRGTYRLVDLRPAGYQVTAIAPTYRPSERDGSVELAAGENHTSVDIVVWRGGVEITGTVTDLTGGPIARAQVRAEHWSVWSPAAETDAAGRYSMWTAPGFSNVVARADGYAIGSKVGNAPGSFDLVLTPEASIEGIVVDERTNQPIAGVHVHAIDSEERSLPRGPGDVTSDEHGRFRIDRLLPGRYRLVAHGLRRVGSSSGSVGVGLAQHVGDVVVRTHTVSRLEGVVAIAGSPDATCERTSIRVESEDSLSILARGKDGKVAIDAIPPGPYRIEHVGCDGNRSFVGPADVVVGNDDVTGLRWEVSPGGTVRGRVVGRSGRPVEGAFVFLGASTDVSDRDGRFELVGVKRGSDRIFGETPVGIVTSVTVDVTEGVTIAPDMVVEEGGRIEGVVVDTDGQPVAQTQVRVWGPPSSDLLYVGGAYTDARGRFVVDPAAPGDHDVIADEDSRTKIRFSVTAGATSQVRVIIKM